MKSGFLASPKKMKLSVRKPACRSLRWTLTDLTCVAFMLANLPLSPPGRLRDGQKHISKVQKFLRTLVDKGRKGLFLHGEKDFKPQGANLFMSVHVLNGRNIF